MNRPEVTLPPALAEKWRRDEITVKDVAGLLGCSPSKAYSLLRAAVGRKTRDRKSRAPEVAARRDAILARWTGGESTSAIARAIGVSREYVRTVIRQSVVPLNVTGAARGLMVARCSGCGKPLAAAWIRTPCYCPRCLPGKQSSVPRPPAPIRRPR